MHGSLTELSFKVMTNSFTDRRILSILHDYCNFQLLRYFPRIVNSVTGVLNIQCNISTTLIPSLFIFTINWNQLNKPLQYSWRRKIDGASITFCLCWNHFVPEAAREGVKIVKIPLHLSGYMHHRSNLSYCAVEEVCVTGNLVSLCHDNLTACAKDTGHDFTTENYICFNTY